MRFDVLSLSIWIQHSKVNFKDLFLCHVKFTTKLLTCVIKEKKTLNLQLSGTFSSKVLQKM